MEIERKYLVTAPPENLSSYPFKNIEQGYLCTEPVVRIRRSDDIYTLTYKGRGLMIREEHNLPLTKEAFLHLREKTDGRMIEKRRYLIPFQDIYTIELDIFSGPLSPLMLAEVEFATEEEANAFRPPAWFGEDVTFSTRYHNSVLSQI